MTAQIQGWGTAVPDCFVTQSDAAQLASSLWGEKLGRPGVLTALYRRSGVKTRCSVLLESSTNGQPARQSFYEPAVDTLDRGPSTSQRLQVYEQEATRLAARAVQTALTDASLKPSQVDHLITVSCSGFSAPGVDIGLIQSLGLRPDVTRSNLGFMGCHGALNGLRVAHAFAAQNPESRILLCCVELCSLHQQYTADPQQLVANALFSDGAAALILHGDVTHSAPWKLQDQKSHVLPDTGDLMSWRIGDHGFEMSLSPEVPAVIETSLRPWLAAWLSQQDLRIEDIASWGIHPGGPRILTACADSLQINRDHLKPSQEVLADLGNMSSPTILFILERLRRAPATLPCVALAFGPGLTIEAALFV